eukprot:CAMPEP_0113469622 /NCGR_PEP_ID=MMETSP0014_2-20120614/15997_1 /TAXON_ID=2857 /ORGANISM="Nitzschia sp." /LENGTH=628 /DNA_ID=CAMNT_0000362111 /DNA_START=12 /DNA_END=1898 /DNA_ORIENTATION=+ /assembly_acc=CAM_ASM_000159
MSGEEGSSNKNNTNTSNSKGAGGAGDFDQKQQQKQQQKKTQQQQKQHQQQQQQQQKQQQQKQQLCFVTLFVPTVMMAVLILGVLHLGILGGGTGRGNALKLKIVVPEQPQQQQQQQEDLEVDVDVGKQKQNQQNHQHANADTASIKTATFKAVISPRVQFVSSTVIIPHDQKIHRGGEDAASTSSNILVVADGVGGWARHGVNPGLFSKALTSRVVELFEQENKKNVQSEDFDDITTRTTEVEGGDNIKYYSYYHDFLTKIVHQANIDTGKQHLGSATCTTVMLQEDSLEEDSQFILHTVNVGDSGYSIHRRLQENNDKYELLYASVAGQKSFNFPHQLGGSKHGDAVEDVATYASHKLQPNDILVVYSDGVSDNLFPQQFHSCFERYEHLDEDEDGDEDNRRFLVSYSVVADCIALTAYHKGKDNHFDSPFAQGARAVNKNYMGGKHDDITVVVAQVVSVGVSSMIAAEGSDSEEVHVDGDDGTASTTSTISSSSFSSESPSTSTSSSNGSGSTREDTTKLRILDEDPYRRSRTTTTTTTSTIENNAGADADVPIEDASSTSSRTSIYYLYTQHDLPIGSVEDLPTQDELLLERKRKSNNMTTKKKSLATDDQTSSGGSTSTGDDEL